MATDCVEVFFFIKTFRKTREKKSLQLATVSRTSDESHRSHHRHNHDHLRCFSFGAPCVVDLLTLQFVAARREVIKNHRHHRQTHVRHSRNQKEEKYNIKRVFQSRQLEIFKLKKWDGERLENLQRFLMLFSHFYILQIFFWCFVLVLFAFVSCVWFSRSPSYSNFISFILFLLLELYIFLVVEEFFFSLFQLSFSFFSLIFTDKRRWLLWTSDTGDFKQEKSSERWILLW